MQNRFIKTGIVAGRWFLFSLWLLLATSCTTSGEVLQGQFLQKGWTKTAQSYCAGGSDYLVLALTPEEEIVLMDISPKRFAQLHNRKATLTGQKLTKEIKPNTSQPFSQHPVGPDGQASIYSCTVFKVKKIKLD